MLHQRPFLKPLQLRAAGIMQRNKRSFGFLGRIVVNAMGAREVDDMSNGNTLRCGEMGKD
jgi:hypothetical protein